MSKLKEDKMGLIDTFLTFFLRNDKDGAKKYVDNHPGIKKKRKEVKKAFKDAGDAYASSAELFGDLDD